MDHLLKIIKKFKEFRTTGNLKQIYRKELNKACFSHDTEYSDSKDLAKRTVSEKTLKHTADKIAVNPKYDGYQRGLESIGYNFFDKKTEAGMSVNGEIAQ